MRNGFAPSAVLVLILLGLPSVSAQPSQHAELGGTLGGSTEPKPPPVRLPVEGGPYPVGPTYLPDGRIGINGPMTISSPGKYLVMRDVTSDDTIVRVESSDVELDLGGHTLLTNDWDYQPAPVRIGEGAASTLHRIEITNGTLENIYHSATLRFDCEGSGLVLEDLTILGSLVLNGWSNVQIARVTTENYRFTNSISISDCTITNSDFGANLLQISFGLNACVLSQNSFGPEYDLRFYGSWNIIRNNKVHYAGEGGVVELNGNDNSFSANNVATRLVVVGGHHNHIVGNLFWPNSSPVIRFEPSTWQNVYRGNTSFGDGVGIDDQGEDNISHLNNFVPDPM